VAASVRPLAVAAGAASDSDSEDDGDDAGSLPAPSSRPVRTRKQTNFYGMVDEGDIGAEGMAADRELEPEAAAMSAEALLPPEPRSYEESQASPEREQWQAAVESELQSLAKHNTFRLTRLPDGRRCIGSRWVLRRKYGADGQVTRYKARLVAKGYAQVEGVDYFESEIRAPALHPKALRAILSIVASLDYELKQMDVPTAFLNAVCKEDIYMKVPSGYPLPPGINAGAVLKLEKTLYGIKQAPREWNIEYNNAIVALGYTRLSSDTCVYVKRSRTGQSMIIPVFVDDSFPACATADLPELMADLSQLMAKYHITECNDAHVVLAMRITRDRKNRTLKLEQQTWVERIIKEQG